MDESVTINFVPAQLITWLIIGLIAGLLAGLLVRGRGLGFIPNIAVGLLGAVLGGFIFTVLGIQMPESLNGGITLAWSDMFIAFIGAVIILLLFGGFYSRRRL